MNPRVPHVVHRFALVLLVIAIAATVVACSDDDSAPARSNPSNPAPTTTSEPAFAVTGTDFYRAPDPLPGATHGDLIWAEPVDSWWGSPRRAWRVLYRSESLMGDPIAVSGFVIAPPPAGEDRAPDDESHPLPVVAWAHGTVGSADACAPSRTFERDEVDSPPTSTVVSQLLALVDRGAVVAASDYEGLGTPGPHPFLVGESAGRSVLDAVKAARQLPEVRAGSDVLLYGISQGGHAALWAGQLAAQWTPDLDILGVVAAAPFSEVDLLLPAAATLPEAAGYLTLGVYGQAAANPRLDPAKVLDPAIVAEAGLIEELCLEELHTALTDVAREIDGPVAAVDVFGTPEWREQLQSIKPALVRTSSPALIAQGDLDTTIPVITTLILVSRMCGLGDTVATVEKEHAGHADIVTEADPEIRAWIDARLAREPAPTTCRR